MLDDVKYRFLVDPSLLKGKHKFTPHIIPDLKYDVKMEERVLREWQHALMEQEERKESLEQLSKQRHQMDDNKTVMKRSESEEIANSYLPGESDGRKIAFQAIWEVGRREGAEIEVCLNAFFLSPDDPSKSIEYLRAFLALRELGFPENDISVALLQTGNDRDKAIDILMNG